MKKIRANYIDFAKSYEVNNEPSATKQSFKDECDLSLMLDRYEKTGQLPAMMKADPQYGDFASVPDYLEACNTMLKADTQFAALPAVVRDRFQNDASKFLDFVNNPENAEEMASMGLMAPEAVERVQKAKESKSTASKKGSSDPKPPKDGGPDQSST